MSHIERLRIAVGVCSLIVVAAFVFVLFGSLGPSERAEAIRSQWRFSAADIENLVAGEVRLVLTDRGPLFFVVPDEEITRDLRAQDGLARYPVTNTFDDELGAYVIWGVPDSRRNTQCAVILVEKSPDLNPATVSYRGGFFDPCNGSHFDLSGRVITEVENINRGNLRSVTFEAVDGDQHQILGFKPYDSEG